MNNHTKFGINNSIDSKIQDIYNTVKNIRDNLEYEKSVSTIDGACHENVIVLCDYFYNHTGYEPYIRWGVIDNHNINYTDLKKAEHDGVIHFWMEIKVNNEWVYVDVFTMNSPKDSLKRGDIYASDKLPHTYDQLENTRFKYAPEIEPVDLLSYEEYVGLRNSDNITFH